MFFGLDVIVPLSIKCPKWQRGALDGGARAVEDRVADFRYHFGVSERAEIGDEFFFRYEAVGARVHMAKNVGDDLGRRNARKCTIPDEILVGNPCRQFFKVDGAVVVDIEVGPQCFDVRSSALRRALHRALSFAYHFRNLDQLRSGRARGADV